MERLKRRTDFREAAQAGARAPAKAFVLQARKRDDQGAVRVGFTVSRQVGNAVERNRVRRRLREAVRLTAAGKLCAGHDYVLIGRRAALALAFSDLMRDLDTTLRRVHTSVSAKSASVTPNRREGAEPSPAGAPDERSPHKAGSPDRPPRGREDATGSQNAFRHPPSQKN
jgi:ribonuclease P protein component